MAKNKSRILLKLKHLLFLLKYKPFTECITYVILTDAESIAIGGAVTEDEIKLVTDIYQLGFDSGYNKGMEEGGDVLDDFDDFI